MGDIVTSTIVEVIGVRQVAFEGGFVAKTPMIVKASREPKYSTRTQNRCQRWRTSTPFIASLVCASVCFRELARAKASSPQAKLVGLRSLASGICATGVDEPDTQFHH